MSIRALVTAGGTREPIDDVRVVTNLSTGRFGAAISSALAERGVEVTLLASHALAERADWLDPRIAVQPFGSFRDLSEALAQRCATPPDLIFMAAAVADYSPAPQTGKIDSTPDQYTLTMHRNPKLLATLRGMCGAATTLVGFKLTSGASSEALCERALQQIQTNQLDACVANDLGDLIGDRHPMWWVTASGGRERLTGTKAETAAELVQRAIALHGESGRPRPTS